jgi:cation diffusion facilitator family transporter
MAGTSPAASLAPGQARTALISIVAACVLVALKLGTGLATGSLALVSAGVESSGDVVAALLTLIAVRLGARPADREHPYGHRRAENLAALGEAVIVAVGGALVAGEAVRRLGAGHGSEVDPTWWLFAVVGAALTIDASRVIVSLQAARRYASAAFRSNAMNFAGDMAGSIAVLVGLLLVRAGYEHGDAVAALVVAAFIFAGVVRLVVENARVLMDRTPEEARRSARRALAAIDPPVELRRLRLRESGGRYFADVVVGVLPGAAVVEAHAVADRVEAALHEVLPASDVVVHVEPRDRDLELRDRVLAAAMAEPLVREAHDIQVFPSGRRATVSLHLKFPSDLPLEEAHAAAERVEEAIARDPDVETVQTHLEPLERPVRQLPVGPAERADREAALRELVRECLGEPPRELRIVDTDAGPVLFLTIALDPALSLPEAHQVASELEEVLRGRQGDLAEVVVHTDPA